MKKIRILLADDHAIMRLGLSTLIGVEKDMEVLGEAESGDEAVQLTLQTKPDVIIMDLMMPGLSGAEATKLIHEKLPTSRILILTSFGSSQDLIDAIENGATGALLKDTAMGSLVDAIRAISNGTTVISEPISQLLAESAESSKLTDRQKEVLTSVVRGLSDKEIAAQFDMTISGAKHHMRNIFAKIGAANRTEAVAIALRKHLLKI